MGFIKAPPGAITRYLWVGGVYGMNVPQLAELFAPYGHPSVILPERGPTAQAAADTSDTAANADAQAGAGAAAEAPPAVASLEAAAVPLATTATDAAAAASAPPGCPTSAPVLWSHAFLAFEAEGDAAAAAAAVPRNAPWAAAGGRKVVVNFADVRRDKRPVPRPVTTRAEDLGVPGLVLLPDFITHQQEEELLAAVIQAEDAVAREEAGKEAATSTGAETASGAALLPLSTAELRTAPVPVAGVASGDPTGPALEEASLDAAGEQCDRSGGDGGGGTDGRGGSWQCMARRRVQHFGYRFDYATRNVDPAQPLGPLPAWAADVARRIEALPQVAQPLDQLTVNEYEPGVGLAPHIDTHSAFTGPIISLSLGSHTIMEMRRGGAARPLLLPPRSLLIMGGESRYAWQHYIPHRVGDVVEGQLLPRSRRVSLTFRQVRGFPCDCSYPDCCDSQQAALPPTRISQLPARQPASTLQPEQQQQQPTTISPDGDRDPTACRGVASGSPSLSRQRDRGHEGSLVQATDGADPGGSGTGTAGLTGRGCDPSGGSANCSPGDAGEGRGESGCMDAQEGIAKDQKELDPAEGGPAEDGAQEEDDGEEEKDDSRLAALESEYVHKVYDAIAPHFSATRFAVWPRVRAFIESLPPGGVVADVGCGNGKYFGVRPDLAVLGSDISAGLVSVAAQRLHPLGLPPSAAPRAADALVADALRLPYRPGSCDGVLCIAVLHHVSSPERRIRLLRQLLRVLRPDGGRALVTVWAVQQEEPAKTLAKWTRIQPPTAAGCTTADAGETPGSAAGQDYFVPWHLPFHRTEAARAAKVAREAAAVAAAAGQGQGQTAQAPPGGEPKIDTAKGAVVFQRYYHLFEEQELRGLAERALAEGPAGLDEDDWAAGDRDGSRTAVTVQTEDMLRGGNGCSAGGAPGEGEVLEGASNSGLDGGCGGAGECGRASSEGAPWGVVEEVFYDRSNWCVVFRRDR